MSNLQVPKTPVGVPASLRQWFDAVGKTIQGFLSKGRAGFLTRGELEGAGVIGIGGDGTATTPTGDLTTPSTVSGLTANGALASIFLNWDAPTSANLAYVEILRADTNDYGTAYPIGTAVRGVNMYKDNVGSGATKYYWVRSVTKAGVKGPPNAVSVVKGTTGYDPSYVMQILTSGLWYPSTLYEPYQYVRPSTPNNYQYVCVSGGTSGATEPTWPTTVGHTVTDGTCTWACEALTTRVPFAIGSVDGQPAVSILSAFIQDACITNAKVHDMAVDKLTAGIIDAISMQLGGYLWNGFEDFDNPTNVAGFWFGMSGSIPRFKLSTGAAGGNKGLTFDGTNLTVTGDGQFDDVFGDNARFELMSANYASFTDRVIPSDYIDEHTIAIDNPDYNKYLCATQEAFKTGSSSLRGYGTFRDVSWAPYGSESYFADPLVTGSASGIICYDNPSIFTVLRFKESGCRFIFGIESPWFDRAGNPGVIAGISDSFTVWILSDGSTDGFCADFKPYLSGAGYGTVSSPYEFTATSIINSKTIHFYSFLDSTTHRLIFIAHDENDATRFQAHNASSLTAKVLFTPVYGPDTGFVSTVYYMKLYIQLWKPEYAPVSSVTSDARIY